MSDWWLIGVRFAVYLTLAALFGFGAFGLYGLRARERGNALALRPWLVTLAALAMLLSIAWLILMASSMAGTPLWPIDHAAIDGLLTGSAVGFAWKVRMTALGAAALVAMFAAGRSLGLTIVTLSSAIAMAMLAWTGHGAMDDGVMGWSHLVADLLHLLAAGAWVGALLGLVLLTSRPSERVDANHLGVTHRALHGFGTVGIIVVATIIVTGMFNAWMLIGIANVTALPTTLYGQLFMAKLALFAAMLGLAALNRFRLTPAFERSVEAGDHRSALVALRTSLAIETTFVCVILGLVAWLGTLAPPTSPM